MPASHSTLRDILRSDGRLSFDRAAAMLADLAAALAPMHAMGQAHGALTPQAVHLDAGGRARPGPPVADTTAAGLLPPAYLAPERIAGEPADPRSDVYALGLIGWEMLTGQTPWSGESLHDVVLHQEERDLPALTTVRPGVPRPLLLAIEGAMHKRPADRWASAGELLAALGDGTGIAEAGVRSTDGAPAAPAGPAATSMAELVPVEVVPVAAMPVAEPPTERLIEPPASSSMPPREVRARRRHGRLLATIAGAIIVLSGGATLLSLQARSASRDTAPWMDSLATSVAAGVLIVDGTSDSNAVRVRRTGPRPNALARAMALADSATLADSVDADTVSSDSAAVTADTAAAKRDTTTARPDTTPVKPPR